MSPEHVAMAEFRESIDWSAVALVTAALLAIVWVVSAGLRRARTDRTRQPADLEPDITGWGNPGEYQTAAPRWRGETVPPLNPADLPDITGLDNDDITALIRATALNEPPPAHLADRCKRAVTDRKDQS